MVRAVLLVSMMMVLVGCGGGGGGNNNQPPTGPVVFLSIPVVWIDNDNDSVASGGDFLIFSFDRQVASGANAPMDDLTVTNGTITAAAIWTNGHLGDNTKMVLTLSAGDIVNEGKLMGGTTFNMSATNTLTSTADGTIGATPAATAPSTVGRVFDTGQTLGASLAFCVEMLDIDGDGDQDAVIGTTGLNMLFVNAGANTGVFNAGGSVASEMVADTRGIGIGNVNADAYPDIVAANTGVGNANRVYLQGGPGNYSTSNVANRSLIGDNDSNGVVVTTGTLFFTWDGIVGGDMFVANNGPNIVYYANAAGEFDGDGTLAGVPDPQQISGPADTRAVAIGDIDSDGDEDVVTVDDAAGGPGVVTVYLVTPGVMAPATFTPTVLLGALSRPRDVALCDLDKDGDMDVVVGYANGNGMQIWLQTGVNTGTFNLPSTVPGGDVRAITCTDIDGDTFDDIIQGRALGQGIAVYINCGGGQFLFVPTDIPGTIQGIAQFGAQGLGQPVDGFDGKGAGDFVTVEQGGLNRVFVSAK